MSSGTRRKQMHIKTTRSSSKTEHLDLHDLKVLAAGQWLVRVRVALFRAAFVQVLLNAQANVQRLFAAADLQAFVIRVDEVVFVRLRIAETKLLVADPLEHLPLGFQREEERLARAEPSALLRPQR